MQVFIAEVPFIGCQGLQGHFDALTRELGELNQGSAGKLCIGSIMAGLTMRFRGEIKTRDKHPNADKLQVCQVETALGQLEIVCGAPNVAAGMKVPCALVGIRQMFRWPSPRLRW